MDGKIFKISGYLVDPNGENEAAWIWEELRHLNDTFGQHVHVKEADIPDWTDENPLNYENCDLAECEKIEAWKPGKPTDISKGKSLK